MPAHEGRTPIRPLYLARELIDWVDGHDDLDALDWSDRSGGRSRLEHLEQTLADFRCDTRPLVGELNRVQPTRNGVWKMHSPGLRAFGWAPDTRSLVLVTADYAESTHGAGSTVDTNTKAVLAFIRTHGLEHTIQRGDRSELFQAREQ